MSIGEFNVGNRVYRSQIQKQSVIFFLTRTPSYFIQVGSRDAEFAHSEKTSMLMGRTYTQQSTKWQPRVVKAICSIGLTFSVANLLGRRMSDRQQH